MHDVPISPVFSAFALPATVTRPGQAPIDTAIVWIQPLTQDFPVGTEFTLREWRRVGALRLDEVPTAPTGTVIVAAEIEGGPLKTWRVDGIEKIEADHVRVVVIPEA